MSGLRSNGPFFLQAQSKKKPTQQKSGGKSRYWTPAVKRGKQGVIKDCGGDLSGYRVEFVDRYKGWAYVKLLEDATGTSYKRGQTFPYKLKWVDWDT